MKYIISFYDNNSVGLTQNHTQTTTNNIEIIDNNRQFIMTCIAPYCSMCGGTGRCGTCQG
jgi:hypothetical protein